MIEFLEENKTTTLTQMLKQTEQSQITVHGKKVEIKD